MPLCATSGREVTLPLQPTHRYRNAFETIHCRHQRAALHIQRGRSERYVQRARVHSTSADLQPRCHDQVGLSPGCRSTVASGRSVLNNPAEQNRRGLGRLKWPLRRVCVELRRGNAQ